jgi:hypothetical protein
MQGRFRVIVVFGLPRFGVQYMHFLKIFDRLSFVPVSGRHFASLHSLSYRTAP